MTRPRVLLALDRPALARTVLGEGSCIPIGVTPIDLRISYATPRSG